MQRHVADQLLEALDVISLSPKIVVDLGAGTGYCARQILRRYRGARAFLVDLSEQMLHQARTQAPRFRSRHSYACADAQALPFASNSVDLVVANFTLPWCYPLDPAFTECHRILRPEGLLLFSSLGPDTLGELRAAWATVDPQPRIHPFIDMHDIGDALVRAGFSSPVLECDPLTVTYTDVAAVLKDLRGSGAVNQLLTRRKGLTTSRALQAMMRAYETHRADGRLPLTCEVVYAHAWRPTADSRPQDGSTVATFPLTQLRRGRQ